MWAWLPKIFHTGWPAIVSLQKKLIKDNGKNNKKIMANHVLLCDALSAAPFQHTILSLVIVCYTKEAEMTIRWWCMTFVVSFFLSFYFFIHFFCCIFGQETKAWGHGFFFSSFFFYYYFYFILFVWLVLFACFLWFVFMVLLFCGFGADPLQSGLLWPTGRDMSHLEERYVLHKQMRCLMPGGSELLLLCALCWRSCVQSWSMVLPHSHLW